ncbi:MAG TPA: ABC transporter substrate-binding protein [Acidobacteriota bacterium]|nr:ABC transporter substrate-binding protein [Acidobacteriota bacterium]
MSEDDSALGSTASDDVADTAEPCTTDPPSTATPLDRRSFVTGAMATAAAAGATSGLACRTEQAAPAVHTRERVRWRLTSSFPRGLDLLYGINERLEERLAQLSGGLFELRAYPAGEIVPGLQVLDAVQQSTVEVGHTASYYYTGKNPAFAFEIGLPFGLMASQQLAWLYRGGGLELMREVLADFNAITFPAGSTGSQMGGWFKDEVNSLDDLQGLKMRIPGIGGEVMSRMGVTVQVIAGGDVYPALERGAIDATEWAGPYDDEQLGFFEIAHNYYYPCWWEPGPVLSFYVNRDRWDELSSDYQAMFESATTEVAARMTAAYEALTPPALQRLLAAGVRLRPFPSDTLDAAFDRSFELFEENAAADPDYRKIYEAWRAAREGSFHWYGSSARAYANFVLSRSAAAD